MIDMAAPQIHLARRLTLSALASTAAGSDFTAWFRTCHAQPFEVIRIPLEDLDGWHFDTESGNLHHHTGRFFTVEGLHAWADHPVPSGLREWWQPVINQPDIAILGILAREINGVLHFLMQAKREPGNVNAVQVSPTVQATSSNYLRVHGGGATPYIDYFTGSQRGKVLVDVLQSEQGAWFYHKRNRNIVVEIDEDVPDNPDFRWLELGQIRALAAQPNTINMDARTVLSCLPLLAPSDPVQDGDGFRTALRRSLETTAVDTATLSWIAERKTVYAMSVRLVPLRSVPGWRRSGAGIGRADGSQFTILGVRVRVGNREVAGWSQPLLAPYEIGVAVMIVRHIGDMLWLLVRADVRPGYKDLVEIGPTVQLIGAQKDDVPGFLEVLHAPGSHIHYDTVHSEEGGRFYHAQNRYLIVEVDDSFPVDVPPDYRWLTLGQLMTLIRYSYYVNIEARTLAFCLNTLW